MIRYSKLIGLSFSKQLKAVTIAGSSAFWRWMRVGLCSCVGGGCSALGRFRMVGAWQARFGPLSGGVFFSHERSVVPLEVWPRRIRSSSLCSAILEVVVGSSLSRRIFPGGDLLRSVRQSWSCLAAVLLFLGGSSLVVPCDGFSCRGSRLDEAPRWWVSPLFVRSPGRLGCLRYFLAVPFFLFFRFASIWISRILSPCVVGIESLLPSDVVVSIAFRCWIYLFLASCCRG